LSEIKDRIMASPARLEFPAGTEISEAAALLVAVANRNGIGCTGDFNGIELVAQPNETTAEQITQFYSDECQRRHEAYIASPAYAKAKEATRIAKEASELAFNEAIKNAPPIELRDEQLWKESLAKNQDPYGAGVYRYAETWARMMQKRVAEGESVAFAAQATRFVADKEGITGFMYGCAVSILAACWVHGEELRRWHNLDSQIGNEGEKANESGGVLNPAVLNIGSKE
jgi:hypothetical protein